jgi:hypothetical protein
MRKQFIDCKTYETAYRRAPWACAVAKVAGGFLAFESSTEYYNWKKQK